MTFFNLTFKKADKNLHFCLKRKLPQTYTLITLGKFGNKFYVFFIVVTSLTTFHWDVDAVVVVVAAELQP